MVKVQAAACFTVFFVVLPFCVKITRIGPFLLVHKAQGGTQDERTLPGMSEISAFFGQTGSGHT